MPPKTTRQLFAFLLLPLVTLSGFGNSYLAPANFNEIVFSDGTHCGLEGTAHSAAGKSLSRLKNRYKLVKPADINPNISLVSMLKTGDDLDRFNPSSGATIRGYVIDVKLGGHSEVCNCGEREPGDRDTHIELALTTQAPEVQRIVVEITPRLRQIMKGHNIDWSTRTLSGNNPANQAGSILHKWVEVTGWMMFDTMHINEAENTNPGGPDNWRASGWEIHPVTSIKVLPGPPPALPSTAGVSLSEAQTSYRSSLKPQDLTALRERNAGILRRFPLAEREDDRR
jgi:hypothetical protein